MFESFYGLSGPPFQLSPDPSFFYGSRGHKRAFAYLQYGLYQGEGFITLTGDVGAGKTTLIRNLLQQLDPNKVVAAQLVSTQLDAHGLLRAVATAFGVPTGHNDKARLIAQLEAHLVAMVPRGRRALLVVDEAQNLAPEAIEELRMLSNFQLKNRALLQSFLVGQPELRQLMRSPGMQQLRQRVIAAYHLGPLDRDETRAYIEHRLKHVGWKGDPSFQDDVFAHVHAFTEGIPRRINTLCTRTLLAAFLREQHVVTATDVQQVIAEFNEEFGEEISSDPKTAVAERAGAEGLTQTGSRAELFATDQGNVVSLERRVVSVERALAITVNLLRQIIGANKGSGQDLNRKAL
jgi:general secretion pathway protein A